MSAKGEQIQISKRFFINTMLLLHALEDYELDPETKSLADWLQEEINTKIERNQRRKEYSTRIRSNSL